MLDCGEILGSHTVFNLDLGSGLFGMLEVVLIELDSSCIMKLLEACSIVANLIMLFDRLRLDLGKIIDIIVARHCLLLMKLVSNCSGILICCNSWICVVVNGREREKKMK